jgi:hypothetical protein
MAPGKSVSRRVISTQPKRSMGRPDTAWDPKTHWRCSCTWRRPARSPIGARLRRPAVNTAAEVRLRVSRDVLRDHLRSRSGVPIRFCRRRRASHLERVGARCRGMLAGHPQTLSERRSGDLDNDAQSSSRRSLCARAGEKGDRCLRLVTCQGEACLAPTNVGSRTNTPARRRE